MIDESLEHSLTLLAEKFQYQFQNKSLLLQALTHRSFHNEFPQKSTGHNERLEFLGDAVLDLALSDLLIHKFASLTEGELSKLRASLVNESTLSELARELELEQHMRLGKGELQSGGALKPRLLACAFEAIVAAIYQDSNYESASKVLQKLFATRLENLDLEHHFKADYKTRLQEKVQSELRQIPVYELEREEGPDHDKKFFVNILLNQKIVATGMGRSKKQAEQDAARIALEML